MGRTRIKTSKHNRRNRTHRLRPCSSEATRSEATRSEATRSEATRSEATRSANKTIIVENFIEMLNTIKLYHWNTHSFSQHKATDELHEHLSEHVDKFVEILLGKKESRIKHIQRKIPIANVQTPASFKKQIYQYREYLIGMNKCLDTKRDTDLLNIRDEILGDINQLLYLLTLQ